MKVLALAESPEHVWCRYRVRAFEPSLNKAGCSLTIEGLGRGPIERLAQTRRAARFDAVLLQRRLLPAWHLVALRRATRRLVFDFDDAILYRDSYDPRGPHCQRRAARFARTVRLADLVLAGNEFLADRALRAGASPDRIRIIPTCIDPGRYQPSAQRKPGVAGVEMVWIGSSSTLQGLERQRSLLERLVREVPGLRLRLICDRFPRFDPLPVVAVPWSESDEARQIAAGDIGIGWVPDDLWSRGKCGLKVLQYQAAGLPVVANPIGVQASQVSHGKTGFLAATEDQWVQAIRSLAADGDLRLRMGRAAREAVERSYSVAAWSAEFVSAVTGRGAPVSPARPRPFVAAAGSSPVPLP